MLHLNNHEEVIIHTEIESVESQEMSLTMRHQPQSHFRMPQVIHIGMPERNSPVYCIIDRSIVILQSNLHNPVYNMSHLILSNCAFQWIKILLMMTSFYHLFLSEWVVE